MAIGRGSTTDIADRGLIVVVVEIIIRRVRKIVVEGVVVEQTIG